jgi:hypothetical protein
MNTVNKVRKIVYVASGFTINLIDLILTIRKPDGSLVTPTVVEQGAGVYTFSYTPDVVGLWQEQIISVSNGDKVIRSVEIIAVDEVDIKAAIDADSTKIEVVKSGVDIINSKIDQIKSSVDELSFESHVGGYFA